MATESCLCGRRQDTWPLAFPLRPLSLSLPLSSPLQSLAVLAMRKGLGGEGITGGNGRGLASTPWPCGLTPINTPLLALQGIVFSCSVVSNSLRPHGL